MRWITRKGFRVKHIILAFIIVLIIYVFRMLRMVNNLSDESSLVEAKEFYVPPWNVSTKSKKIDWHDYKQIQEDNQRSGTGEHGRPAHMPETELEEEKQLYSVNGFNGALSDKIALNRSIPDIRHPACKERLYLADLPTVSVIVPFHNEHWSTLLRTAHTVVNKSPPSLLKEIFLVDDASTKEFLKEKLDEYVLRNIPKVRIVRLSKRSGLIAARLAGARQASGEVLLFLDSHTEANVNWLPPLLEPIAEDYRTAVCPFIDVIAYDTFQYRAQDEGARGAFDWELYYKRLPLLPEDIKRMPEPFVSPVMAGGLFAISAKFFWELGGYDDGLDIWGGEQYELSFKLWQCGGRMLDAPCSRVGHIYRKFAPFPNPGHGDFVGKNFRRVAEVWMDEYAEHLYARRPHYRTLDAGDLTEQKALRERLHCKSFKWFLHNVAFDLLARYPPVDPGNFGSGKIRSVSEPSLCVDAHNGAQMSSLHIAPCADAARDDTEQDFILSWHKDIRSSKRAMCWDLPDARAGSPVLLYGCHLGQGNQLWRYMPESKQIVHGGNDKCLEVDSSSMKLFISACDGSATTQQWSVDQLDLDMLSRWDAVRQQITGPLQYDEHP